MTSCCETKRRVPPVSLHGSGLELTRRIIGAFLIGTDKDRKGILSCGFGRDDIRLPACMAVWQVIEWAVFELDCPNAAIPVMEELFPGSYNFYEFYPPGPLKKLTPMDIGELRRINARLGLPPCPEQPLPENVVAKQRLIESILQ